MRVPVSEMFIYELEPIDVFSGLIRAAVFMEDEQNEAEDARKLIYTGKWLLRRYTCWEGDGSEWIGALPQLDDCATALYLVVKQGNNGTTFVVSPIEMPWLKG